MAKQVGKTKAAEMLAEEGEDSLPKELPKKVAAKAAAKLTKTKAKEIGKKGGQAKKPSSRLSKSGKFKSIRQLMENLLTGAKTKGLAYEEIEKRVKQEYPDSAFSKSHYSWYKNKIVQHGEVKDR